MATGITSLVPILGWVVGFCVVMELSWSICISCIFIEKAKKYLLDEIGEIVSNTYFSG